MFLDNTNGTLQVDNVLNLGLVSIKDGVITDNDTINVTGKSAMTDATLSGGIVTVESGKTLTLDNVTVSGTTINNTDLTSVISIDDNDTLTLNAVVINGGTINDGTVANSGALVSGATINVPGRARSAVPHSTMAW